MSNSAMALIYGVIGSVLFNLSKGMQRQGIKALSFLFSKKADRRREERPRGSAGLMALYATGAVLNNSLGFFAILANRYAPSSYYTSMFGVGLIALMLYSGFVLKEPVHPLQYAGAVLLTLGTLLLGYDGIIREDVSMGSINLTTTGIVIGVSFLLWAAVLLYAHRTRSLLILGVVYGLFLGFSASLDPVLKGIGQNLGGAGRYLPRQSLGWIIFLLSFVFSTLSFVVSQWVFSRGVRASVFVPSQNFGYIVTPIYIQAVSLPGFHLTGWTVSGLVVIVLGIVTMQTTIKRQ